MDDSNQLGYLLGLICILLLAAMVKSLVRRMNSGLEENAEPENSEKEIKSEKKEPKRDHSGARKPRKKNPHNNTENNFDINDISWSGNGSGVIISSDGYIATNNHVISDEEKKIKNIGVEFNYNDEIKTFKARVIKTDPQTDLAIIKIEDKSFKKVKPIPFSVKEEDAELGEQVFALGYPMALTIMGSDIKFTDGRISSKTGFQGNVSTYQSTTPIQPGNSGGPLFDYNGNLIGINSSGLDKKIVDNVSYTIKTSYLKNLINVLPKKIVLPKLNTLKNLDETNKIKELTKYVVLIKVELA